ncbi:hypothetical protein C8R43DRAFT_832641, partial [Mycena crocata]
RRFLLQKGLWLKDDTLDAPLDEDYDAKKRFDGAQIQGQLRDILDILPDHFRQKRSNTSSRIRRTAGTSIYDCSAADLLSPTARRKFRKEIGWYRNSDGKGAYASLDVPILHKDGSAVYDIHTCFLGPALMRLYAALIRGPSGASAMLKIDDTELSIPRTDNMEHIHRIDHTEAGAIAACGVLVRETYIPMKMDAHEWSAGHLGQIRLFDEYLDILTTGLCNKTPSILNVFEEWDRVMFPNAQ